MNNEDQGRTFPNDLKDKLHLLAQLSLNEQLNILDKRLEHLDEKCTNGELSESNIFGKLPKNITDLTKARLINVFFEGVEDAKEICDYLEELEQKFPSDKSRIVPLQKRYARHGEYLITLCQKVDNYGN